MSRTQRPPTPGWTLIGLLSLLPIVLWGIGGGADFSSFVASMRALGQITGLVGLALFAISFLLSLRQFSILEDLFGGLNRAYLAHHIVGGLAFVMILLHPVLLAVRFLGTNPQAAAWLLLPNRFPSLLGWLSLILMILFLGVTFFIRLKYHRWHAIHLVSGLAFIFGVWHTFAVPSDVSRDPVLASYIGLLSGAGLLAFFSRINTYLFGPRRFEYEITDVNHLGSETVEVTLKPKGPQLRFLPGQFAYVSFFRPHAKNPNLESHPFSITSDPDETALQFVIKSLGDHTQTMQKLKVGAIAYLEGPYGRLLFRHAPHRKQVWIAGGIGITPFLSMARSLRRKDKRFDIDLYYCTSSKSEAPFLKVLEKIDRTYGSLRLISWCDNRQGFLSAKAVQEQSGNLKNTEIFIIGPPVMMDTLRKQFVEAGVDTQQIHTEEFSFI